MRTRKKPTPFGRQVKIRLAQLGLEQRDLADMLGTSGAYVTYLIYGERRDEAWISRICHVLNMTEPEPEAGAACEMDEIDETDEMDETEETDENGAKDGEI